MKCLRSRRNGMFYGKGMEHMGTWNMSIQMDKWDGVHLNLRGNLLKAMGVINWLSGIVVDSDVTGAVFDPVLTERVERTHDKFAPYR